MKISQVLLALLLLLSLAARTVAQPTVPPALESGEATTLAELMCRQLPNVTSIIATVQVQGADAGPAAEDPPIMDDVYDALVWLGPYSVPCLVDRLADAQWMPDPRSEPLMGTPLIGDVAYMILGDKGVPDVLPGLAHRKLDEMRNDEWFLWPSVGDHRHRLQMAVREWLRQHPNCYAAPPVLRKAALSGVKFRMSATELARASAQFSQLRPGMSPVQVLGIVGKPDAIDKRGERGDEPISVASAQLIGLLGSYAGDRNENLAYIYFTERWTDVVARRDPLRDRYVIVFFSAEGEFTRMFSNVADISPIFPSTMSAWHRLMWGETVNKK
jgi:hypothetical protein